MRRDLDGSLGAAVSAHATAHGRGDRGDLGAAKMSGGAGCRMSHATRGAHASIHTSPRVKFRPEEATTLAVISVAGPAAVWAAHDG